MKKLDLNDILESSSELKRKKVGFVAIIGRPNVGKSTFVNSLIGEKISIISSIPQTTRKKIFAIYNDEDSQIVFFDTPGIHDSDKIINQNINSEAISSLEEANLILYFIDSTKEGGLEEKFIKSIISKTSIPIIKVYTKTDLKPKINIPQNENCFKISSVSKKGFPELIAKIKTFLKEDFVYFPEEYYTKQDIYFRISEIIREKIFSHTYDEVPHNIFIEVSELDEKDDKIDILAYIYCNTENQKQILIGKAGSLLSVIGKESRLELEKIFDKKIFLKLRVKVSKNWKNNKKILNKMFG